MKRIKEMHVYISNSFFPWESAFILNKDLIEIPGGWGRKSRGSNTHNAHTTSKTEIFFASNHN